MKGLISFLILIVASTSCSVKPERLRYGVDNCSFCKMTLADDKFGGELVTTKGKVFKFDDIKCMINFIHSPEAQSNQYAFELVVDYGHKADEFDLIPAKDAYYVQSSEINSPMGGAVAAFKDQSEQQAFQHKSSGSNLSWSEVSKAF